MITPWRSRAANTRRPYGLPPSEIHHALAGFIRAIRYASARPSAESRPWACRGTHTLRIHSDPGLREHSPSRISGGRHRLHLMADQYNAAVFWTVLSSKGGLSIAQSPRACPNLSCSVLSLDSIERELCLVRVMSPDRCTEKTALEPRKRPPNVALAAHLGASLPLAPARFPDSSKSRPHKRSHRWLAASIQGDKGGIPGDRRWGSSPQRGSAKIGGPRSSQRRRLPLSAS